MIEFNDIKKGMQVKLLNHRPSWGTEEAMNRAGFHVGGTYEVIDTYGTTIDLRGETGLTRYFEASQLGFPYAYDVSEWNID